MASRTSPPQPNTENSADTKTARAARRHTDAAPVGPDGIAACAARYFEECDATRERVVLKNGDVRYRQTPYTLAGLSAALSVPRIRLEELRLNAAACAEDAETGALRAAVQRVEQYLVERALLGELDADMTALLLEGWGYVAAKKGRPTRTESAEPEPDPALTVVLEDPDGLAR